MAASSVYSHKELEGKSGSDKQEMLFQKNINWNDYATKFKRGSVIKKHFFTVEGPKGETAIRSKWVPTEIPIFTEDKEFLTDLLPKIDVNTLELQHKE